MAKHLNVKKAYGTVEGPFGFPMTEVLARAAESALKLQPKEVRSACSCTVNGQKVEGYGRMYVVPAAMSKSADDGTDGMWDESLITTGSVDRDREVLIPEGGNFRNFNAAGGVVTFAHKYDELPVGRCLWVERAASANPKKDGWKAKTLYHPEPANWKGPWLPVAIFSIIKSGGMNGKSIGFVPTEGRAPEEKDIRSRPELAACYFMYSKWDALEYAVASVPCNPSALMTTVAKAVLSKCPTITKALEESGFFVAQEMQTLEDLLEEDDVLAQDPVAPAMKTLEISGKSWEETYAEVRKELMGTAASIDVSALTRDEFARMSGKY